MPLGHFTSQQQTEWVSRGSTEWCCSLVASQPSNRQSGSPVVQQWCCSLVASLPSNRQSESPVVQPEWCCSLVASRPSNRHSESLVVQNKTTYLRVTYSVMFYSILGCALPLQELTLLQNLPTFSVLCHPCPYRSSLPHNVISPTTFWSLSPNVYFFLLLGSVFNDRCNFHAI